MAVMVAAVVAYYAITIHLYHGINKLLFWCTRCRTAGLLHLHMYNPQKKKKKKY